MAKNIILTFYVTLTFTFDLGCQKFICLSISYNMRQVGSLHDKQNQSYDQQGKQQKIVFPSCDLDLDPMTLIYEHGLDIMEMYLYAKNEVLSSKYSKVIAEQTDTHRQTDRQTDRQIDATENITYPHVGGNNNIGNKNSTNIDDGVNNRNIT